MSRNEEETTAPAKKDSGNMKLIIISLVIVLSALIIGGGLFFGLKSSNASKHEASAATEGEANKDVKQDGKNPKKKETPVIYPLEAFIVNVGDGKDMRYLKVKVELETAYTAENVKKEMDPYLAPLRDSILILLTTKTIQDVQDLQGKNKLREEIVATVNKIVEQGKIKSVYFTDFVVQ